MNYLKVQLSYWLKKMDMKKLIKPLRRKRDRRQCMNCSQIVQEAMTLRNKKLLCRACYEEIVQMKVAYLKDKKKYKDQLIIEIFDYWPFDPHKPKSDPPCWEEIRYFVKNRDGNQCRFTGCISKTNLQVHHIKPRSCGGSHDEKNLVTLCRFHHACESSKGHDKIKKELVDECLEKSHHKRKEDRLITEKEFYKIADYFHFTCQKCKRSGRGFDVNIDAKKIKVTCRNCKYPIEVDRKLPEETGPELTYYFAADRRQRPRCFAVDRRRPLKKSFLDEYIEAQNKKNAIVLRK